MLIAIGCDGVFETQELRKLPDLVLSKIEFKNSNNKNNNQNGEDCSASQQNENDSTSSCLEEANEDEEDQQQQPCSLSIHGTVKVAQRSISKIQPISEQGGLLPGSDNVTFITVHISSSSMEDVEEQEQTLMSNKINGISHSTSQQQQQMSDKEEEPKIILSPREKAKQCC